MIRLDYLPKHPNIHLYQDDEMFLINSDTMALGQFLEVYRNDTVLDMGTNTGALLLYASLFNPKKLIGIDLNEKALNLAKNNLEMNNIVNFSLVHADINNYLQEPVDVIICNPPYFQTEETNKSKNNFKNLAKHESGLKLADLMKAISLNLKDNGVLYFLFLTSRMESVILEMKKNNLAPKIIQFVYDKNKEFSNVFVVKAVKNAKIGLNVLKPLIIDR